MMTYVHVEDLARQMEVELKRETSLLDLYTLYTPNVLLSGLLPHLTHHNICNAYVKNMWNKEGG